MGSGRPKRNGLQRSEAVDRPSGESHQSSRRQRARTAVLHRLALGRYGLSTSTGGLLGVGQGVAAKYSPYLQIMPGSRAPIYGLHDTWKSI